MKFNTKSIVSLSPINNSVLVRDMVFTERMTQGGILLPGDDGMSSGIRPRWAEVYQVGPDQTDVKAGDWILVSHGRWTRASKFNIDGVVMLIQMVDTDEILLISEVAQSDETFSDQIIPESNIHKNEGSMHNHHGEVDPLDKPF